MTYVVGWRLASVSEQHLISISKVENQERLKALLEGLKSSAKRKTTSQEVTEECPENSNVCLEDMEAAVLSAKWGLDNMEAMDLQTISETAKIKMERKKVHKEEAEMDSNSSLEDR